MSGSGDLRRTVRLFRRFGGGQRWAFAVSGLLLVIEAAGAVAIPGVLGWIIDTLEKGEAFLTGKENPPDLFIRPTVAGTIVLLALLMVAFDAVKSLSDSLAEISLAKAGRSVGYNLRVALFGHLQKLSLAFHVRKRTGDVLTRLTADVTAMEEFLVKSVSDLAGSVLLIVFTLSYMLYKSWEITLLAVVIMPLLASVSNWFAKRIKAASKDLRASEGDLASSAQEMLTSISVVQTYGRSGYEERRFAEQSHSAMNAVMRTARLEAAFSFTVGLMQSGVLAGVIYLGGVVLTDSITTGTVVAFVLLMDQMFKPTRRIIKEWNTISKLYASVERINDLFGREPAVQDAPDAVVAPPLRGHIEFRDVSFAYRGGSGEDTDEAPTRLALDSLSLTIAPGEVVALVGHSGAGKSTIAQLLPRLYDPHAGTVLVDGMDVRTLTLESLRAQVGMVLQEAVLFSGTIAENIGYGREGASREEVVTAAKQANAHDFISELPEGYDTVLGERAATLSGGQRQRLSIARAFVRGAPILVLDEPTTGLDAESSDLVMQGLTTLLRGKTAVIISHDFKLMELADRVLVMSAGRILEEGRAEDLLARGGLYADLHARQFGKPAEALAPAPAAAPAAAVDGDGEPAPMRRREFETVLLQAVPLPASPEAFQLLTGH
ncbi:MAG: ABC transporter ATP-binding protein, partial [Actinomycetes bacterium]